MPDEEKPYNGPERRVKMENRLTRIEMTQENLVDRMDGLHTGFSEMRKDLQGWQVQVSEKVATHTTDIKWLQWKFIGEGIGLLGAIGAIIWVLVKLAGQ